MTPGVVERPQPRRTDIHQRSDSRYFLAAFGLLIFAAIIGALQIVQGIYSHYPAPDSLTRFFEQYMSMTRIAVGTLVILISPLSLNLLLRLYQIQPQCTPQRILFVALIPPTLAFVLSWLPTTALLGTFPTIAVLAWFLFNRGIHITLSKATLVWATHGIVLSLTGGIGIWALESLLTGEVLKPLEEIQQLRATLPIAQEESRNVPIQGTNTTAAFLWNASGSVWLDKRANLARIEIQGDTSSGKDIEVVNAQTGAIVAGGRISNHTWQSDVFLPEIEVPYRLRVKNGFSPENRVTVHGLLPPDVGALRSDS